MSTPSTASGRRPQRTRLMQGLAAGLAGGVVFGAAMSDLGEALPAIVSTQGGDFTLIGLCLHLLAAAVIGLILAALTRGEAIGSGEMIFWGVAYGALWWLLGALTLLPVLRGDVPTWGLPGLQAAFPSLLGHLAYGATAGAVLAALAGPAQGRASRGAVVRGGLAGFASGGFFLVALAPGGANVAMGLVGLRPALVLTVGTGVGVVYSLLYPRPRGSLGTGLIRGFAYGFLAWLVVAMTLIPVLAGDGLPWELAEARARAASLPALLLAGVFLVGIYRMLTGLVGALFEDNPADLSDEGVGTRALRGLGRGAIGGLVGGLLFTIVIAEVGDFERIAGLASGSSMVLGFLVHVLIAILLGASYGVLFRHENRTPDAALGWGVAYGLLWWVLGGVTLLPLLLGGQPAWTAAGQAAALPSLIGHLAYGAGLGLTLAWLERRSNPWWTAHTAARARRSELRRAEFARTAPGLWAMTVVITIVVLTLVVGS